MLWAIVLFVLVSSVISSSASCEVDPTFPGFNTNVYTFQTSNTTVNVNISFVNPPVDPSLSMYLSTASCLGQVGPLGSYGPLGSLGPLGSNTWNPSYWISGSGMDWTNFSKTITGEGGPLSWQGPLGSTGPLGSSYYQVMPCMDDFDANLALGGLWTILGPLGPLGALGPLGPLGTIGATGYQQDDNGQFLDSNGNVVRTIMVPWDATPTRINQFELYETYTQSFANSFQNNDCSFMVEGDYGTNGANGDTYTFMSYYDQYVTILLVPMKQLDTFSLTVLDRNGNVICSTGPDLYIDWVQIRVPQKTQLTVVVKLESSMQMLNDDYRLYVTGSTLRFDATNYQGPHLVDYQPVF